MRCWARLISRIRFSRRSPIRVSAIFRHIHFWKHRRLEIPRPRFRRACWQNSTTARRRWRKLPSAKASCSCSRPAGIRRTASSRVSSKFPPLMQTMLDWSGATAPARFQFQTGDAIPSPASLSGGAAVQWQKPDGKKNRVAGGRAVWRNRYAGNLHGRVGRRHRQFAVNLPVDESRTAPMPADELARLGVPLGPATEVAAAPIAGVQQRQMQRAELENRQKLWRWLLAAVLAVMLAEIILSGWLARRATAPQDYNHDGTLASKNNSPRWSHMLRRTQFLRELTAGWLVAAAVAALFLLRSNFHRMDFAGSMACVGVHRRHCHRRRLATRCPSSS